MEKQKVKKSVLIRQAKEAAREQKEANYGKQGSAVAFLNNVPSSPRKMRMVADLIRGKKVDIALNILKFEPRIGARDMEALLKTAIANWKIKNEDIDVEQADLYIKEVFVDGGKVLKRLRPAPQGRGHRIRKRSNHITMLIESSNQLA